MKIRNIIIGIATVTVITASIYIIFQRLKYKEAISIAYLDNASNIEEFVDKNVKLLCRTAQMTGVWFVAEAIEVNDNEFSIFSRGRGLYVSGEDPFLYINDELTIYSHNYFILEGRLSYDDANEYGPGYCLSIDNWDIVYPIKTAIRLPCFQSYIYYFDLKK